LETQGFRLCCIDSRPTSRRFGGGGQLSQYGSTAEGHQTVLYTLLFCISFLIPFLLFIPSDAPIKKIILLAVEGAGYSVFPSVIRQDYVKWKTSNPGVKPRNDYASIGWGVLGALMYFAIAALILAFRR
jgi:hypothetical protein